MAPPSKGNAAGFHSMQIGILDSTGICTGQVAGSDGVTSSMLRVRGGTAASFNPVSATSIEFNDADGVEGNMSFGGGNQGPFQVTVDRVDADAIALAGGSLVDITTNSFFTIFSTNPKNTTPPDMCMILTQKFQSRVSASSGVTYYKNHIIPVCQIRTLAGGLGHQAKQPWTFEVTPQFATKLPNGEAFGSNQGWTDNETDILWMNTQYPIAYTYFQGDNSETTFITGFRPISTVITLGGTPNWYTEDGTQEALTSIVTATGVATPDGAPASGVKAALIYQTEFAAI